MRTLVLLVYFIHLPLGKSAPVLEKFRLLTKLEEISPAGSGVAQLDPIPTDLLRPTNKKQPETSSAQSAKLEEEVTLEPLRTSSYSGEARSPPPSPSSDTSLVESLSQSADTYSSTTAPKNLPGLQKAIDIYQRLTDKLLATLAHSSIEHDGSNVLPKLQPNLIQKIKNPSLLISSIMHLKTYFATEETVELIIPSSEIFRLKARLAEIAPIKIRNEIVNSYYQLLFGSNKDSSLLIELDPAQYKLVNDWKKNNLVAHQQLQSFMSDVLSPLEFLRRSQIIEAQADQFRIYNGWDAAVKRISAETGYSPEEVSTFGQKLAGKEIFPSFKSRDPKNHDFKAQLAELEASTTTMPELAQAWRNYLKSSYDTRVTLLTTLSQMKHPDIIPSETISAWQAQNFDVELMLKIVDFNEETIPTMSKNQDPKIFEFTSVDEYKKIYNLIKNSNLIKIKAWRGSLEHRQLSALPEPTRTKYLQMYYGLSAAERQKTIEQIGITHPKFPGPTKQQSNWWKRLLGKAKGYLELILKAFSG